MRWVVALFLVLLSIPAAQVAADMWHGRPGPELLIRPAYGAGELEAGPRAERREVAPIRHSHFGFYESFSPWFPPRAKTGARTGARAAG